MKITSLSLPKILLFIGFLAGLLVGGLMLSKIFSQSNEEPGSIALQSQSDICIDGIEERIEEGDKIQIQKCNDKDSQKWSLYSDGSLRIQDYCMQMTNNSGQPKTAVIVQKCDGSSAQVWRSDKSGALINSSSNLCLEPKEGKTENGTELWVNKCNGSTLQKWSIASVQSPNSSQDASSSDKPEKVDKKTDSTTKKTSKKTDQKSKSTAKKTTRTVAKQPTTATKSPTKIPVKKPTSPTKSPAPKPAPSPSPARWTPKVGQTWQYQLMGNVDLSIKAAVYDIDGFDTPASKVDAIHKQGSYAICYISAGSWEDWRPDASQFPSSVKGKNLDGWPGEKWLDTRNISTLGPIMSKRMDMCVNKGFDGVEFDNVDGHIQDSGFNIKDADQLEYNKWLASTARAKGLKVGLKNNLDQVSRLVGNYDFAVNEECYVWNECNDLKPFINAGKPVFHVEYARSTSQFCPTTTSLGFSSIKKSLDLKAPLTRC